MKNLSLLEVLNSLVHKANEKLREKKYEKIREIDRKIVVRFTDDGCYYTRLSEGCLSEFKTADENERGDIEIYLSTETLKGLLDGSIDAVDAYLKGNIKIKAKLMDKVLLAEILKS